jgi:hypothetical protein
MKNFKIEIKWALVFALAQLAWMAFEKVMGWHDDHIDQQSTYTLFFAPLAIGIYVLALIDKKKNFYWGKMSYLQGLTAGLVVTLIVVILSPLTQYITSAFITPDFFQNIIEYTVSTGIMQRQDAESYFNLKSYIQQAVIGAAFMGLITSAVIAFFTKSK